MTWQHPSGIGRNNFDFIRFILAVAVIFSHSYFLLHGSYAGEFLLRLSRGQLTCGDLAVDWFFLISGYLITHSWLRSSSTFDYLKKRVLRIYPGFIEAVLVCLVIVAPIASPTVRHHFLAAIPPVKVLKQMVALRLFHAPGTFAANPTPDINRSLWTIPYEFCCYLGVVALGLAGFFKTRREFQLISIVLALIALCWLNMIFHLQVDRIYFFGSLHAWGRLSVYYLLGVAFYLFRDRIPFSRILAAVCALIFAAAMFLPVLGFSLAFTGTYVLFWFAFEPRIRLENWARFGDFSYGIYIFAYPVQQLLIMKLGAGISPLWLFLLSTPLTILAGAMSWHLVERRFLKLKKRHLLEPATSSVPAAH